MKEDLVKIVNQAIPLRTGCAADKANDIARRAWLLRKINQYVESQLSNQFNAKSVT